MEFCPECGSQLIWAEACVICPACGYSTCCCTSCNGSAIKRKKQKVVVEVYGGIAEVKECPVGVDFEIIDHDMFEDGCN